jgi:hypothetical protein
LRFVHLFVRGIDKRLSVFNCLRQSISDCHDELPYY